MFARIKVIHRGKVVHFSAIILGTFGNGMSVLCGFRSVKRYSERAVKMMGARFWAWMFFCIWLVAAGLAYSPKLPDHRDSLPDFGKLAIAEVVRVVDGEQVLDDRCALYTSFGISLYG